MIYRRLIIVILILSLSLPLLKGQKKCVSAWITEYNISGAGKTDDIEIDASLTCSWTVSTSATWIGNFSRTSGTGPAMIEFEVFYNPTTSHRTAIIEVGNVDITVRQARRTPNLISTNSDCGQTVLTLLPVSGGTAYWQTSGTSLLKTQTAPKTFTSNGTYYYRVYWDIGIWSEVITGNVIVNKAPSAPTFVDGSSQFCSSPGDDDLRINAVANATSYVWEVPDGTQFTTTSTSFFNFEAMNGSGNIKVYAKNSCGLSSPAIRYLTIVDPQTPHITGTSTFCQYEDGLNNVTLNVVDRGEQYTWNIPSLGLSKTGTSASFDLSTVAPGTYPLNVRATVGGCFSDLATRNITIKAGVEKFSVTGGGDFCNEDGFIGLQTSRSGIRYELIRNATPTNITKDGNGSALSWNNLRIEGNYTVEGTHITSGCTAPMLNSKNVTINEISVVSDEFFFNGAGGDNDIEILAEPICNWTLSASDDWIVLSQTNGTGGLAVNFTVFPNNTNDVRTATISLGDINITVTQAPNIPNPSISSDCYSTIITLPIVNGGTAYWQNNASSLDYGPTTPKTFTSDDIYYFRVYWDAGFWSDLQTDDVIVNKAPTKPTFVNNSSQFCNSIGDEDLRINPVHGAVEYVWEMPDGITFTGPETYFNNFAAMGGSGQIKVYAQNSCGTSSPATRDLVIIEPQQPHPTGTFSLCQYTEGLNNSTFDVIDRGETYTWDIPSLGLSATGTTVSFDLSTVPPGTYPLNVRASVGSCYSELGTRNIIIKEGVEKFDVAGGGNFCNEYGFVTLVSSAPGVEYELIMNDVNINRFNDGDGGELRWGSLQLGGAFKVEGIHKTSECSNFMNNSVDVVIDNVDFNIEPKVAYIDLGESVTLNATGEGNFIWSPATGLNQSTGNTVEASPTESTAYTLSSTDYPGCSNNISSKVHIKMYVELEYTKPTLTANVTGGKEPYTYEWNDQPGVGTYSITTYGEQKVTITDALGQLVTQTIYISEFGDFNQNYIKVAQPTTEINVNNISNISTENSLINYQYFDGLGRPVQTVSVGASYAGNDIVQTIEYDDFGRGKIKYMPYEQKGNGGYRAKIKTDKEYENFYSGRYENEIGPFTAVTEFEKSPLSRPLKQGAPGADWQIDAHPVEFKYETNVADDVKRWNIANDGMEAEDYTEALNDYEANSLYVTTTTDENGKTSKEYKNLLGQVVLTEAPTGLRTYYIYDDFGLLRCVIPPKANSTVDDKLCYFYRYDARKRMVTKKIPGADSINMVYDKLDRLVLTQDGNMRSKNQWMATFYDELNRPEKTGIFTSSDDALALTGEFVTNIDYLETQTIDEQSQTFYDNYSGLEISYSYIPKTGYDDEENTDVNGLITYTRTWVPDMEKWLTTVNYYDDKYRVIQTIADNHLGGRDVITNKYDFVGKVDETIQEHTYNGNTETIVKQFDYDHAGRLTETKMGLGTETPKTITQNTYNELGQLKSKGDNDVVSGTNLVNTSYIYNIRGWMTDMDNIDNQSNDLFNLDLRYNTEGTHPQYNGNISLMKWSSFERADYKEYDFSYDDINRLTTADYSGSPQNEDYSTTYSYDKNGNILKLHRFGWTKGDVFTPVDSLNYGYVGNRLVAVNDVNSTLNQQYGFTDNGLFSTVVEPNDTTKHEYFYDANGNLIADYNKGIEAVRYNHLNLPSMVDLGNNKHIEYIYDAVGIKLQQRVYDGADLQKKADYIGNFVYQNDTLAYILTDDGRLVPKRSKGVTDYEYNYEYFIKDHLGNTRVTVIDNSGEALVMQESHYYPFGMQMEGVSTPLTEAANKYLYNGKELQDDLGLDWYDYGARFYDAQLGRWHSTDPADQYASPYIGIGNNPINLIDPDGRKTYKENMDEMFGEGNYWYRGQAPGTWGGNSFDFSASINNESNSENTSESSSTNNVDNSTSDGGDYGYYIYTDENGNKRLGQFEKGKAPAGAIPLLYSTPEEKQKSWELIQKNGGITGLGLNEPLPFELDVKVTVGAQAGLSVSKNGLFGNVASGTLWGYNPNTGYYWIGKGGETEINQSVSGGVLVLSGEMYHTFMARNGGARNSKFNLMGNVGYMGVNAISGNLPINYKAGDNIKAPNFQFRAALILGLEFNLWIK